MTGCREEGNEVKLIRCQTRTFRSYALEPFEFKLKIVFFSNFESPCISLDNSTGTKQPRVVSKAQCVFRTYSSGTWNLRRVASRSFNPAIMGEYVWVDVRKTARVLWITRWMFFMQIFGIFHLFIFSVRRKTLVKTITRIEYDRYSIVLSTQNTALTTKLFDYFYKSYYN